MPGPGLARRSRISIAESGWPPAALTLARIQLHAGDRTHADELARQILSEVNTGPSPKARRASSSPSPRRRT